MSLGSTTNTDDGTTSTLFNFSQVEPMGESATLTFSEKLECIVRAYHRYGRSHIWRVKVKKGISLQEFLSEKVGLSILRIAVDALITKGIKMDLTIGALLRELEIEEESPCLEFKAFFCRKPDLSVFMSCSEAADWFSELI